MKKMLLVILLTGISFATLAQKNQKKTAVKKEVIVPQQKYSCDSIVVDFENGLLNGKIGPGSPADSIKKYLPCVATEIPFENDDRVCGGGMLFEKQGIYFNLEHGFIEFNPSTTAYLPLPVFGVHEDDLEALTGEPVEVKDLQPYTDRAVQSVYLFPKKYGCLAIWVDQKDKITFKVQLHSQSTAKAYLCIE